MSNESQWTTGSIHITLRKVGVKHVGEISTLHYLRQWFNSITLEKTRFKLEHARQVNWSITMMLHIMSLTCICGNCSCWWQTNRHLTLKLYTVIYIINYIDNTIFMFDSTYHSKQCTESCLFFLHCSFVWKDIQFLYFNNNGISCELTLLFINVKLDYVLNIMIVV